VGDGIRQLMSIVDSRGKGHGGLAQLSSAVVEDVTELKQTSSPVSSSFLKGEVVREWVEKGTTSPKRNQRLDSDCNKRTDVSLKMKSKARRGRTRRQGNDWTQKFQSADFASSILPLVPSRHFSPPPPYVVFDLRHDFLNEHFCLNIHLSSPLEEKKRKFEPSY